MNNVLFINNQQRNCGVNSYGVRVYNILKKSKAYNFVYREMDSMGEYHAAVEEFAPIAVIYNYHPLPLAWFDGGTTGIKHYCIHHEGSEHTNLHPDYWLYADSMTEESENRFALPRPLIENAILYYPENNIPVISSFGFGFGNKGFGRVVKAVNDEFDEAIIRLHIPFAYYGDLDESSREKIYPGCYAEMKKPGIKLQITNNFLTDHELLQFLAESDLNIFLYDEMLGRGLSSVIDYALSVERPICISNTYMFRHINKTEPSICYENRSLQEIIASGSSVLNQYREKWSNQKLIDKIEWILNTTV